MTDIPDVVMPIADIVWDPTVYPRLKWSTQTIARYAEALESGEKFPPIVLEKDSNRLLDGKHRLEAYKKAGRNEMPAVWHVVPEGISPKRYAARLSARHGDRMSNADLKALAIEDCEADPQGFNVAEFAREMGLGERTVYDWVAAIKAREREARQAKVLRLSMLGWTQSEMGELLGVAQQTVSDDTGNCGSAVSGIRRLAAEGFERGDIAPRFNLAPVVVEAIMLEGKDDIARLERLGINLQPYDVWHFQGCHDLMGDTHPGRIPGELVAHVLYFFTEPGDLVVDPMAGSGTTLDACLLMGRNARGFDIDLHHDRVDIEHHDIAVGWPDVTIKASLVFWDPPYFDKKNDEYVNGSISSLERSAYLEFFSERFAELRKTVRPGTRLAFLMSDWNDDDNDEAGIYVWHYAGLLEDAGWMLRRHIQVPLSTQQVHPDIVNKFRAARRLTRLGRDLLIAVA